MAWLTRVGVRSGLAGLCLLGAANSLQNAVAEGSTRTLSFHHVHTGEDITVTFKRNGRFDKAALKKLDRFMRDWRKDQDTEMDPNLIDLLWEVYREVGATQPIQIICGYRSPRTNAMLRKRSNGVARFSQHTSGHAIDFFIPGVPLSKIREVGMKLQDGGVGFYPSSGSPFVHMDTANIRHWPRMSRDQLVKLFPDGRTVHVPSDGVPLRNYALALADVERRGKTPNAVSLAQAREAGVISEQQELAVGQNVQQPQKNLLAALFGIGNDEDEDKTEVQATTPATATPAARSAPVKLTPPVSVARNDRVPLPHARPEAFTVASANTKPLVVASAGATPVSVESSNLEPSPAAVTTAAVTPVEPATTVQASTPLRTADATVEKSLFDRRGYWQGVMEPAPTLAALKARAAFAAAVADSVATGSTDSSAMAFAAPAATTAASEPAATTTPMGARVAHLVSTANIGATPANTTVLPKALLPATMAIGGQHLGSPWLRAAMLTPSMRGYMNTTTLGALDPRWVQDLLHKPPRSLTMTFSSDPNDGLVAHAFSGQAVVFLATTTFVRARTASLQ